MLERTHIQEAPWWIVQADDKRPPASLHHHLLGEIPYAPRSSARWWTCPSRCGTRTTCHEVPPEMMFVPDYFR